MLRLWNLAYRMPFDYDQEVASFKVKEILIDKHLTLIGPKTSIGELFVGPLYSYTVAPLYYFASFNPYYVAVFINLIHTLAAILFFQIAKELFSKKVGLLASLLYATSPLVINNNLRIDHLTLLPLMSLLVFLSIIKLKQGKKYYFLILASCLGFAFNLHPQAVFLIPIAFISMAIMRIKPNRSYVIASFPIFVAFFLPLMLFDLRHHFLILKNLTAFLNAGSTDLLFL